MFEPNTRFGGRSFYLGIILATIVFLFVILQFTQTGGSYFSKFRSRPKTGSPSGVSQPVPRDLWPVDPLHACITTGCSSQICAEEDVVTTCEFREEYTCYKGASCERQTNGECGWTETQELQNCLDANIQ